MDDRYYVDRLAADRLRRVYEEAPERIRQYLEAEIDHVRRRTVAADRLLEVGCGYGRVMRRLARPGRLLAGVDISRPSLDEAGRELAAVEGCHLVQADAAALPFKADVFDAVICVQNGLSAIKAEPLAVLSEAVRVTRRGGRVLVSGYADSFWDVRLDWFRRQAAAGLIGELDPTRTGDGIIVGRDGFRATTLRPDDFRALATALNLVPQLTEVDGSCLFLECVIS